MLVFSEKSQKYISRGPIHGVALRDFEQTLLNTSCLVQQSGFHYTDNGKIFGANAMADLGLGRAGGSPFLKAHIPCNAIRLTVRLPKTVIAPDARAGLALATMLFLISLISTLT